MNENTEKDQKEVDGDQETEPRDIGNAKSELERETVENAKGWLLIMGHGV